MRVRVARVAAWGAMVIGWLGCNAILGNESAVYAPDERDAAVSPDIDAARPDDASADIDAATADAGPCARVESNPKHCGACFHDCLGGDCTAGKCQPFELATDDGTPDAIAIDATHVYWTNQETGSVKRVSLAAGHTVETIFEGQGSVGTVQRFALHGGRIYFPHAPVAEGPKGVWSCPVTGCGSAPDELLTDLISPNAVAIVGETLFATDLIGKTVEQCTLPCASGSSSIATGEPFPSDVAKDDAGVAWTTLGAVRVKHGDEPPFSARKNVNPVAIAFVGDELVYADRSSVNAMHRDGGTFRNVSRTQTSSLAVDATGVYFADKAAAGAVYHCPLSGCPDGGARIADKQPNPTAVAIDDKSIVWINSGPARPAIVRVAR